jgi:hypothetical protein
MTNEAVAGLSGTFIGTRLTGTHAFTIHVTALILVKGVLFARSSRLISDKLLLVSNSLVMDLAGAVLDRCLLGTTLT